jgi:hypothetical protein
VRLPNVLPRKGKYDDSHGHQQAQLCPDIL